MGRDIRWQACVLCHTVICLAGLPTSLPVLFYIKIFRMILFCVSKFNISRFEWYSVYSRFKMVFVFHMFWGRCFVIFYSLQDNTVEKCFILFLFTWHDVLICFSFQLIVIIFIVPNLTGVSIVKSMIHLTPFFLKPTYE